MLWQMLSHSLKAPNLQTILKLQQLEVPQALKTVVLECLTQPRGTTSCRCWCFIRDVKRSGGGASCTH
jgi:hypothetical protein